MESIQFMGTRLSSEDCINFIKKHSKRKYIVWLSGDDLDSYLEIEYEKNHKRDRICEVSRGYWILIDKEGILSIVKPAVYPNFHHVYNINIA